ncbi:MAG: AAA family ATPase [Thermoleophilia bacterium]|nr:AAA family ATPase [Thermoleophilia bacterium]
MSEQPIRIFISGACAGLAEARDALASHRDIELVGTASEPSKAGSKLASTGAQVILHALQRPDTVPAEEIAKIREHTSAPIILLVTRSTPSLLDEAVALGLNDVMLLPQLTDNLVFTVKKAHSIGSMSGTGGAGQRRSGDSCRVITLFSPKGGVGKTVLATSMGAMYAKRLKKRTLLIDLDLQFGDAAIMLGADPRSTILDLVMSHGDLDSDKLAGFITHHESGLHLLPAPLRPEDDALVTDDRLASVLTAAKQAYDIILIDTAPNFTSTVLTALDRTDELMLVGSLEATSLKSVKVCLQTLEMLHYPLEKCHVVLNRADTKVGLKKDQVEKALGKAVRFGIPSNKAVPTAINRGVPVVMTDPKADVTRAVRDLCVAFSPEATGDVDEAQATVKLSRRERKRLANETQRAQLRDAELAGTEPTEAAPAAQASGAELEFEFGDEAAA